MLTVAPIALRELYEFVTSPLAMPAGYRPVISPEFPWDYFDESRRIADDRYPKAYSKPVAQGSAQR